MSNSIENDFLFQLGIGLIKASVVGFIVAVVMRAALPVGK